MQQTPNTDHNKQQQRIGGGGQTKEERLSSISLSPKQTTEANKNDEGREREKDITQTPTTNFNPGQLTKREREEERALRKKYTHHPTHPPRKTKAKADQTAIKASRQTIHTTTNQAKRNEKTEKGGRGT